VRRSVAQGAGRDRVTHIRHRPLRDCSDCGTTVRLTGEQRRCSRCVEAARALVDPPRSGRRTHTIECVDCGVFVDTNRPANALVCVKCSKAREKDRRRRASAKRAAEDPFGHRDSHWRRTYGVSGDEVRAMFEAQGGRCPVCTLPISTDTTDRANGLALDHCHETGTVGGVLHGRCNIGIGLLGEDPANCRRAADYLLGRAAMSRSPAVTVPDEPPRVDALVHAAALDSIPRSRVRWMG